MKNILNLAMHNLRINYRTKSDIFDKANLTFMEPIKQFKSWFNEALECNAIVEPNAMALATSTLNGIPSVRFLLLKGVDENGFSFFTNSLSKKGMNLSENPIASIAFYWAPLSRQVRIEGKISILDSNVTDEYFNSRPKESRISALVSERQSSVISNREVLINRNELLTNKYNNEDSVPRPNYWLGYNLNPTSIEFWQGQTNRLHDRILFRLAQKNEEIDESITTKGEGNWLIERLSP